MWDLAVLGIVPNMRVAAPRDAVQLRAQLHEAIEHSTGPTALRFPKASVGDDIDAIDRLGGVDVLRRDQSSDVLVVSVGALASLSLDVAERVAAQGIGVTVVDPRWVLPIDAALPALAAAHELVVVIEDGVVAGGIGSALSRDLRAKGITVPVRDVALPQQFLQQGSRGAVLASNGLAAQEVARQVIEAASGVGVSSVTQP
jgi:1-deoxy-D-xylulose-5-phosphate synthase